jgi:hypothetical protein
VIRNPATKIEEEKSMSKIIGTCFNCKRPEMKVNNTKGTGICGSCQLTITGTKPGSPEREAKLKEAAERFAGKSKMTAERKKKSGVETKPAKKAKKGAIAAGSQLQEAPKVEEVQKPVMPNPDPASRNPEPVHFLTSSGLVSSLPSRIDIAIKIPFTNRFINIFQMRIEIHRTCRVCGCTDDKACEGGCYWVDYDLCSSCAAKELLKEAAQSGSECA